MKNFTALLFMIVWVNVSAQTSVYHPFPDSSAFWTVDAGSCCYNSCPGPPINPYITDIKISYYLDGDTSINSLLYHKLFKNGNAHEHCAITGSVNNWWYYNNVYLGAYRQDVVSKKVYFVNYLATQECLLYDFDLSVGDTLDNCMMMGGQCAIIESIDSILIGNDYRKKFNLFQSALSVSLIEGIGSTSGLFEPLCPFEVMGILVCFSQNNQTLYPDSTSTCSIASGINEIKTTPVVKISPNPFINQITVQVDGSMILSEWVMYNYLGMKVRNEVIDENEFVINRSSLVPGIYILQLKSKDGAQVTQKIIAR